MMTAALVLCAMILGQEVTPAVKPDDLPVSLDRIQRALSTKPAIDCAPAPFVVRSP